MKLFKRKKKLLRPSVIAFHEYIQREWHLPITSRSSYTELEKWMKPLYHSAAVAYLTHHPKYEQLAKKSYFADYSQIVRLKLDGWVDIAYIMMDDVRMLAVSQ